MRIFIGFLLIFFTITGFAQSEGVVPLPPDQAFSLKVLRPQPDKIVVKWAIAPDYYLYRNRLSIGVTSGSDVQLKPIMLPSTHLTHQNARGGKEPIYTQSLEIPVYWQDTKQSKLDLVIAYQGCSANGFCYAPQKRYLQVNLADKKTELTQDLELQPAFQPMPKGAELSKQDYATHILDGHNFFLIILTFLGLGLLLSLTPCVLPMAPILSGIIMGHRKKLNLIKSFLLSLAYVLGMSITYAIAGMLVALAGSRVQTFLQSPIVIVLFSGIFVLLALSLFGVYELQLPVKLQQRLTAFSNKQKGGTYFGVFLMGSISSLIVSPCISAPLVGVLAYIGQTGSLWLGGTALLALGFGMGIPLLLLGISAGSILPRAGHWMVTIERIMGLCMLAFAIWMVSRVIPGPLSLLLWSIFFICWSIFLGLFSQSLTDKARLLRGLGLVAFVYGIILMIGVALGNSDPLHPWENWQVLSKNHSTISQHPIVIKNMEQLDQLLLSAKQEQKPVIIDFYADWCESCIWMERHVFNQEDVLQLLNYFMVLRADVTANNSFDQALLKRFNVIAPPTFLFFNTKGEEIINKRIVGQMTHEEFLQHLNRIEEK